MYRLILIFVLTISACSNIMVEIQNHVGIEQIVVYSDFDSSGYTTVGAYTHFDDLEIQGINENMLSYIEVDEIERIMSGAKQFRHIQRKHPGGLIFCKIKYKGKEQSSRVVISIELESVVIMDLTTRKDFIVKNKEDIKRLQIIENKIKLEF